MSRIGIKPIEVPKSVTVDLQKNHIGLITANVVGPKGTISRTFGQGVTVEKSDSVLSVKLVSSSKQAKANFGTTRAHLANMVKGVTDGWTKKLELHGVGYTSKLAGSTLTLIVGYSHEVNMQIPKLVNCKTTGTVIELDSVDVEVLGTFASKVKDVKPPEPYLGKGIRFFGETVRRKAGKTGKSGK
jgi:large subunit ribosomal protein L6